MAPHEHHLLPRRELHVSVFVLMYVCVRVHAFWRAGEITHQHIHKQRNKETITHTHTHQLTTGVLPPAPGTGWVHTGLPVALSYAVKFPAAVWAKIRPVVCIIYIYMCVCVYRLCVCVGGWGGGGGCGWVLGCQIPSGGVGEDEPCMLFLCVRLCVWVFRGVCGWVWWG
jgi:hypothetical protein